MKTTLALLLCGTAICATASPPPTAQTIEQNGAIIDVVYNVTGGQPLYSPPGTKGGYEPLGFVKDWGPQHPIILKCVDSFVHHFENGDTPTEEQFSMQRILPGAGGGGGGSIGFSSSFCNEIDVPTLDSISTDPVLLGFTFEIDRMGFTGFNVATKAERDAVKADQKHWLPSNFKLSLGDMPTSQVQHIEAFSIKGIGDLDGDGAPDIAMSNVVFNVPFPDAMKFLQWPTDSTGQPIAIPLQIDILAADGSDFRVNSNEVPVSMGFSDLFAGDGSTNQWPDLRVEMRCVGGCGVNVPS